MVTTRAYLVMGISILGMVTACFGSIAFARTVYAQYITVRTMQEDRLQLTSREGYVSTLRTLARETSDARAELAQYVEHTDPAQLIQVIGTIGEDAGVDVSTDSVSTGTLSFSEGVTTPTIDLTMRAVGSFQRVTHFLALLESSPLPLVIENVSVEQSGKSGSWIMVTTISIIAYEQE